MRDHPNLLEVYYFELSEHLIYLVFSIQNAVVEQSRYLTGVRHHSTRQKPMLEGSLVIPMGGNVGVTTPPSAPHARSQPMCLVGEISDTNEMAEDMLTCKKALPSRTTVLAILPKLYLHVCGFR